MSLITRRSALFGFLAAPAIIKIAPLMRISPLKPVHYWKMVYPSVIDWPPYSETFPSLDVDAQTIIRMLQNSNDLFDFTEA